MNFIPEKDGSFNFACGPNVEAGDCEAIFCGWNEKLEDVPVNVLETPPATLGPLLVALSIFSSRTEAKKQGWDKPFPTGYAEIKIGKLSQHVWKHRIYIWNPTKKAAEYDDT